MADIIITCQNCGNTIPVSEYVDANLLTCMKCKARVPVPERTAAPAAPVQKLKLAVEKPPDTPPPPVNPPRDARGKNNKTKPAQPNDVRQYLPKAQQTLKKRRASNFEAKVLPWLVFVILSVVLCWLRYWPGALPANTHSTLITAGIWALVFIHVTIVCYAFGDDSFYGILCLIIPGYSLYYLYIQADQMILRSVMAALMIAFGWDTVLAGQQLWKEIYTTVSIWIATTDTIKK